jgi:hypothetical protein
MERMLLKYFVNDEWAARGLQPLSSIFEQVSRPSGWRSSFFDQLETPEEQGALSAILERMVVDGLLVRKASGDGREVYYGASEKALKTKRYDQIYPSTNSILTEAGEPLMTEDGQPIVMEGQPREAEAGPQLVGDIDSSRWTGLPSDFVLTAQKQATLIKLLEDAEHKLDAVGASNTDKSMARAYIVAARVLADVPEPQADIIWELISRANQLAGIASLFVSIIALFAAAK